MKFGSVSIASVSHVDAPHRIASEPLERRIEETLRRLSLPTGLLEGLSGIRARRFWDEDTQPSEAATLAAERAIGLAGIDRQRLGVLINTSVCRDYVEPSTACLVHRNLGLGAECLNFDVGNACLGFLNGMEIVGNMIERGQIESGIVVDGESARFVVEQTLSRLARPETTLQDFQDSFATLTLGSGSAAMVLVRADGSSPPHRLIGSVSRAATEHNHLCRGQVDYVRTDSRTLLAAGVELARQTYALACEELGWTGDNLDELILHQVSKVHTERLAATLGIDKAKVMTIYPEFGNIGPAAVPIALSKSVEAGRIRPGSRVGLMGIGSGLNCTMAEIVW